MASHQWAALLGVRRMTNPKYISQYEWAKRNPEQRKAIEREYRRRNRDKINEWKRGYSRRLRKKIVKRLGEECVCCRETRIEFLTIDHIAGNGKSDRAKYPSLSSFYVAFAHGRVALNGYRLLCMNCNHSVGMYGYCPHGKL